MVACNNAISIWDFVARGLDRINVEHNVTQLIKCCNTCRVLFSNLKLLLNLKHKITLELETPYSIFLYIFELREEEWNTVLFEKL